eukprot:403374903
MSSTYRKSKITKKQFQFFKTSSLHGSGIQEQLKKKVRQNSETSSYLRDNLSLRFQLNQGSQGMLGSQDSTNSLCNPVIIQIICEKHKDSSMTLDSMTKDLIVNQSSEVNPDIYKKFTDTEVRQKYRSKSLEQHDQKKKLMNQMEMRLSGFEYRISPKSSVTYQSIDSFIDFQKQKNLQDFEEDKEFQKYILTYRKQQLDLKFDKYDLYRRQILLIKSLMALKINLIRQKTNNKIELPKLNHQRPFYLIALIKSQFHKFRQFQQHKDNPLKNYKDPNYQQKKLKILHQSLSNYYNQFHFKQQSQQPLITRRQVLKEQQRYKMIFDKEYRLKNICYQKLKFYLKVSRKRRVLNFNAMKHWLLKYNRISILHWKNIFKHNQKKYKQFAKRMKKLINNKTRECFQKFKVLMQSHKVYQQFVIERETFLFSIQDHNFQMQSRNLDIAIEKKKQIESQIVTLESKQKYLVGAGNILKQQFQNTLNNTVSSVSKQLQITEKQLSNQLTNSQSRQSTSNKKSIKSKLSQKIFEKPSIQIDDVYSTEVQTESQKQLSKYLDANKDEDGQFGNSAKIKPEIITRFTPTQKIQVANIRTLKLPSPINNIQTSTIISPQSLLNSTTTRSVSKISFMLSPQLRSPHSSNSNHTISMNTDKSLRRQPQQKSALMSRIPTVKTGGIRLLGLSDMKKKPVSSLNQSTYINKIHNQSQMASNNSSRGVENTQQSAQKKKLGSKNEQSLFDKKVLELNKKIKMEVANKQILFKQHQNLLMRSQIHSSLNQTQQ